ncbi:MAG: hypothetical protein ACTSPQ_07315, partial [Candidatus Helarchaeota archaeon]
AIYGKKDVSLFWFQINEPLDHNRFIQLNCAKDRAKNNFNRYSEEVKKVKLVKVGGIWRSTVIFGTKIILKSGIEVDKLKKIAVDLEISRVKLLTNFKAIYPNIPIRPLDRKELINFISFDHFTNNDSRFYLTGLENVRHFLDIPKMLVKSIESKYPAEFSVPTNLDYDIGPIGGSIETEFQEIEREVGLTSKGIKKGILTCGDSEFDRFKINAKIIYEALIQEYPFIIITSNKHYRKLIQHINDIIVFPFKTYGIDIFEDEGYDREKYIAELEKIFRSALSLDQEFALSTILLDVYNSGDPGITTLINMIENKIKNEGNLLSFRERRSINRLLSIIEMLTKSEASNFFNLKNLKINNLIHNSIFEIDIRNRDIRRLVILLLILKITVKAYTDPNFGNSLILLIDDADFVFNNKSLKPNILGEEELILVEVMKFIKQSGIIPFLSTSNPKNMIQDILMELGNVFVSSINLFDNILSIRHSLNLQSNYGVDNHRSMEFYSKRRKYGYQFEYIRDLGENELLFKRSDMKICFPIKLYPLNFKDIDYLDTELKNRLSIQFPKLQNFLKIPKYETKLEKDFRGNIEDIQNVLKILLLLVDYPSILISGLKSATGIEQLNYYLDRLLKLGYIRFEQKSERTHKRNEIKITQKGLEVYNEYIDSKNSTNLDRPMKDGVDIYGVNG